MSQAQVTTLPRISPSLIDSLLRKFQADFMSNWRLAVLGLTGLILSIASGWTTYNGMTNFTREPVLSLMITFGIQGVMLVTAWLIGESFATARPGASQERGQMRTNFRDLFRKVFPLLCATVVLAALGFVIGGEKWLLESTANLAEMPRWIESVIWGLCAALGFVTLLILLSHTEIIGAYARGVRTILAHLPLWFMFLACLATSVFFSFDSLFSTIFPAEERRRAGDLRAEAQISGIAADIGAQIKKRQGQAAKKLFAGTSWKTYEGQIGQLLQIAHAAPDALESKLVQKIKARQSSLAREREALSSARAEQRTLVIERDQLVNSLKRLEAGRPEVAGQLVSLERRLRAKRQEIAAMRAEAEAEARGVGGTGKAGRGPNFRALQKSVTRTEIEIAAIDSQRKTAQTALDVLDSRRQQERVRLLEIEKTLGRLKSRELSATEGVRARETLRKSGPAPSTGAIGGFQAIEREMAKFRRLPSKTALNNIETFCGELLNALNGVASLKSAIGGLACETGSLNEAAGAVFATNDDLKRYQNQCGTDARIPSGSTDAALDFGRRCLITSGLPGSDTQSYRDALNRIALNRDDKAHRFVVTWNAFADGNRLSYLALTIAIAIDGLVFMSGLFGAAAVVSPLADSPRARNRSVSQLHEIIDNALLPEKAYAAELVMNVMDPRVSQERPEYIASIDLSGIELDQAVLVRKVLTAGASLGLVTHVETNRNEYLIRSELFEYISAVRAREAKLGNLSDKPSVPRYAQAAEKTLPERRIDDKNKKKSKTTILLDADETRQRYISEMLDDLELDGTDEQFLETLIIEHNRIESALKRLFRWEPQIEKHLLRVESDVAREIETVHERLMNKWHEDYEKDYQIPKIKRRDIKCGIILGLKLPVLRADLQREIDNSESRTLDDAAANYYHQLDTIRQILDGFLDSGGREVSAEALIGELHSFRSPTRLLT